MSIRTNADLRAAAASGKLDEMEWLYLSGTQITDLSPLAGMPLELLDLNGTQIADLSPLAGMPLQLLYLNGTQIAVVHIDPRNYELRAPQVGDETWYIAGCRLFKSAADALAHWGGGDYPDPYRGAGFCKAINVSESK